MSESGDDVAMLLTVVGLTLRGVGVRQYAYWVDFSAKKLWQIRDMLSGLFAN